MRPRLPSCLLILAWCLLRPVIGTASSEAPAPPPLEGVILVIADGVSFELLTGARLYQGGAQARLHVESLPNTAIIRTASAGQAVTDSAAAATAIARGYRTQNAVVGARPDGSAGPSLLDVARKAGWSTGLVTDDAVMGGTIAAFIVEAPNRFHYPYIASRMLEQLGPDKRVDLLLGGGYGAFNAAAADEFPADEAPLVEANAAALAERDDLSLFRDWEDFVREGASARTVLGLLRFDKFPYYGEGTRTLRLGDMAEGALAWLQARQRPYLLVVEAALPDKASHGNKAKLALLEVLEFDETLRRLMEKAGPNVLVVATTDHGTGGFAINQYQPAGLRGDAWLGNDPINQRPMITWATGRGAMPNANEYERTVVAGEGPPVKETVRYPMDAVEYRQPAALPVGSASHTAGDVWAVAVGPGSEGVRGFLDNSELFRLIGRAILVEPGRTPLPTP